MKLERNENSLIFSTTQLADAFFTEYLSEANGDYIKLYLYLMFLSKYNKEIKINDLSKTLNLPLKTIQDGIKYWEDKELILKKTSGYIVKDIQEIELTKLYKPKITSTPEDLKRNAENKYRAKAIENINNQFFHGVMSPSWYGDIDFWFNKYQFSEEVMNALFNYCFDRSALHRNYIETVAGAWFQNNIKTFSDLEKYYEKQDKLKELCKSIKRKLGYQRDFTQYEQAYIEKWSVDFNYSLDIIEIALKKTTSKSNLSFDYIDKILSDWHDRKFRKVEEIQAFLTEMKNKNKSIKDLENKTNYQNKQSTAYNFDDIYANKN